MFIDRIIIQIKAGKGGNGTVAWRREKFIPMGGPSGGNGGHGASVYFEVDENLFSLESFRHQRFVKAEDGKAGEGGLRQGKKGRDLIIKVPPGTLLKESDTGTLLYDFTENKEQYLVCKGGRGGKGNSHFKSSRNRSPTQSTPGAEGEEIEVELELKLIADVGLVGLPNAGKSSFLNRVTEVDVKIAPYPFTTLQPNLGYIFSEWGKKVLLADIPGIIRGASQNRGLGLEFLRHIERTSLLLFVIDISGMEERDPWEDYQTLLHELKEHNPHLLQKPSLIALNKMDLEGAHERALAFQKQFRGNPEEVIPISNATGEGVDQLVTLLKRKLER